MLTVSLSNTFSNHSLSSSSEFSCRKLIVVTVHSIRIRSYYVCKPHPGGRLLYVRYRCRGARIMSLAVNLLREELEQTQHHYDTERQKYAKIRAQMKIKEKIRRDLGGLTDTVVSGMGG